MVKGRASKDMKMTIICKHCKIEGTINDETFLYSGKYVSVAEVKKLFGISRSKLKDAQEYEEIKPYTIKTHGTFGKKSLFRIGDITDWMSNCNQHYASQKQLYEDIVVNRVKSDS